MERIFENELMNEIKERWSPRAFSIEKISDVDINAVIEAANYAPSCFNEQPWRFVIAKNDDDLKIISDLLSPRNQLWASKAPVLILILAHKFFGLDKNANPFNKFDAGTAWGILSLEAQKRGLATHAMGGFNSEKARLNLNIPEEFDIVAVVALGKIGDKNNLDESFRNIENPGTRKPYKEIILNVNSFKK